MASPSGPFGFVPRSSITSTRVALARAQYVSPVITTLVAQHTGVPAMVVETEPEQVEEPREC